MRSYLAMVICLFVLSVFAVPVIAQDIDCSKLQGECLDVTNLCRCDLVTALEINGGADAAVNSVYTASGGRAPYSFEISTGAIDAETGVVTEAPQCVQLTTVSVTDVCEQLAQMNVELSTGGPLKISGPEDFLVDSNGSYSASGGVAPYTFSSSCGSVDSDTGEILDDANCCSGTPGEINEVEISVTDSCGDTASMQARGKNGHWVTQLNTGPPGWPSNYIRQTLTAGAVRTTYYYTSCGCYFSQEAAANPGGCMGFNSKSNDGNEPAGAIQYYTNTICGENPPSPYTNLEGALYRNGVSSHPGWCYQYGNLFEIYGWRSYCQNSDYIKVEHFECQ